MEFDAGTWWVVTGIAGVIIAVVTYFLKRTISKTDEHDKDISQIKQTYVTKSELESVRAEIKSDVSGLAADVKEIKEKSLTKADFYRTQTATEQKIDKMYDLLLKLSKGGMDHDGR